LIIYLAPVIVFNFFDEFVIAAEPTGFIVPQNGLISREIPAVRLSG
jgi:hypothetical protein